MRNGRNGPTPTSSRSSNCWRRRRTLEPASSCSTSKRCRRGSPPTPAKARPPQAVAVSPWTVFGEANFAGGNRDSQVFLSSYDYKSPGGSIGIGYRVNPNLRVGGVFGYAQPNVNLAVQGAHYKIDAF